jgi:hypothetical protein
MAKGNLRKPEKGPSFKTGKPSSDLAKVRPCLEALTAALEQEIETILDKLRQKIANAENDLLTITLLNRSAVAKHLKLSLANLDRMVAAGEIQATYLDTHPRFPVTEIARFIEVKNGRRPSTSRRRKK